MAIQFWDGVILFRDGAMALDPACCCGEGPCPCCSNVALDAIPITFYGTGCELDGPNHGVFFHVDPGICSYEGFASLLSISFTIDLFCSDGNVRVRVNVFWHNDCQQWPALLATFEKTITGVSRINCLTEIGTVPQTFYDDSHTNCRYGEPPDPCPCTFAGASVSIP